MKKVKRLLGITLLVLVASLGTPQAFATDGFVETPGVTLPSNEGISETPGIVAIILDYLAALL
jgi:hypothetical protein